MYRNKLSSNQIIEELIKHIGLKARNIFVSKQLMCSETVLTVLNRGLSGDLPPEMAVRLASGLPEGMGSGCTCGSLSGGVLALGLFLGRNKPGIGNGKRVKNAAKALHDDFKNRFGATCCRVLVKGYKKGSKEQFHHCSLTAGFVVEATARLILKNRPELADFADWSYLEQMDSKIKTGLKKIVNMISS